MKLKWTGDVIKKLHVYEITQKELAAEMGVTPEYVSRMLNAEAVPASVRLRITEALNSLIAKRTS